MNIYLVFVVTSVIMGVSCSAIARRFGRNPLRWFFLGVLLNILALATVLYSSKRKEVRVVSER